MAGRNHEVKNITPLRPPAAAADIGEVLRDILGELRGLRGDLRRQATAAPALPALIAALEAFFGAGRFSVAGVLGIVEDDSHGAIGNALAECIDTSAPPRARATALGRLFADCPHVEIVGRSHNAAVYRLTSSG